MEYRYKRLKEQYLNIKSLIGGNGQIHVEDSKRRYWSVLKLPYAMYIGTSPLDKKEQEGTDDVYFIFEKITHNNYEFWRGFCDQQHELAPGGYVHDVNGKEVTVIDGMSSLRATLEITNYSQPELTSWVAYVYLGKDKDFKYSDRSDDIYDNIEMAFTVFFTDDIPIITHIGILRNIKYINFKYVISKSDRYAKKVHKKISVYLHAFSAKVIKTIYNDEYIDKSNRKLYMVTLPAIVMRDIIVHGFKQYAIKNGINLESILSVGSDRERKIYDEYYDNLNHDLKLINQFETLSFSDLKRIKDQFVLIEQSQIDDYVDKYGSFEDDYKEIYDTKYDKYITFYSLLQDLIKYFVDNEEELELFKKNFMDSYIKYRGIKAHMDKIIDRVKPYADKFKASIPNNKVQLTEYATVAKSYSDDIVKHFIPADLKTPSLLNDISDDMWSIKYNDENISFRRPQWFRKHKHLWGGKTVRLIVSLDHLQKLY
jgi:hypothetical protein